MSKASAIIPTCMCDTHPDNIAQALCRYHKKLLCLTCVLEKAKTRDCSFIEIGKVSGENDTLLLKCLSVRQMVAKQKRLIEEHENNTGTLKDKLAQDVNEMHGKLTKRLDEMKEHCLKSINEQAKSITAANKQNQHQLLTLETAINAHIDKLSTESVEDEIQIRTILKDVTTEIIEKLPEKDTMPDGEFKPNNRLTELILISGASLGSVSLINTGGYETIDYVTDNTRDRSVLYAASDEVVYTDKKDKSDSAEPDIKAENVHSLKGKTDEQSKSHISDKLHILSPDGKLERKLGGILKWFSSDKRKTDNLDAHEKGIGIATKEAQRRNTAVTTRSSSEPDRGAENIYQESTFNTPSYTLPKYLINRTVKASGLKQHFPSACKFSKLVDLGDGYIGMLSEVHNALVLVGTDEHVYSRKTFKEGKHIATAVSKQEIAVIDEPGLQVTKYQVSDQGFTTTAGFMVNEEITNITGFDYDVVLLKFAVSSPDKVIVLNKRGKKLKAVQYGTTQTPAINEIATTYDFSNDCLYVLNITDKTLKMFSLEKSSALWKRRFGSHSVMQSSMCLYKDKLYIPCGDAIAIFSTSSGMPIGKHDTHDLLEDCFGICVIDEVLLLSSNSDNFEKSTTLAYISL